MKNIYTIIAFCSICFQEIHAQITLTSANFPVVGNKFEVIVDTLAAEASPGNSGSNQTYDLSGILNHNTRYVSFDAVSSSPNGANFPNAELVTSFFGAEGFIDLNSSEMNVIGFAGDPTGMGLNLNTNFNNPQTLAKAPNTFGSSWNDQGQFIMGVPASALAGLGLPIQVDTMRITYSSITNSNTDGYGTLITPDGTWPCLRTYQTVQTDIKIEIQSGFPFWIDVESTFGAQLPPEVIDQLHDTTYTYNFLTDELNFPRASVEVDIDGMPIRAEYAHVDATGLANLQIQKVNLFPNPANDKIYVLLDNFNTDYTYSIQDIQGKNISDGKLSIADNNEIPIQHLNTGLYFIRIYKAGKIHAYNKFLKQ